MGFIRSSRDGYKQCEEGANLGNEGFERAEGLDRIDPWQALPTSRRQEPGDNEAQIFQAVNLSIPSFKAIVRCFNYDNHVSDSGNAVPVC